MVHIRILDATIDEHTKWFKITSQIADIEENKATCGMETGLTMTHVTFTILSKQCIRCLGRGPDQALVAENLKTEPEDSDQ